MSLMKVSENNIVPVAQVIGAKSVLAGVTAGQAAAVPLSAAVVAASPPPVLDFSGLEIVTASAFREAVLVVVRRAAEHGKTCILVNLNEVSFDEARIAVSEAEAVVLIGRLRGKALEQVEAFGQLDQKLGIALRLVLELGEADAKALKDASGEPTVITAWNNRLVALHRAGLLRERKSGKTKFYSPVVEGMTYGN